MADKPTNLYITARDYAIKDVRVKFQSEIDNLGASHELYNQMCKHPYRDSLADMLPRYYRNVLLVSKALSDYRSLEDAPACIDLSKTKNVEINGDIHDLKEIASIILSSSWCLEQSRNFLSCGFLLNGAELDNAKYIVVQKSTHGARLTIC